MPPTMGLLNKTRVYLVGHMQYVNGRAWRSEITPVLEEMGVVVFDPYHKPFEAGREDEITRSEWSKWMEEGRLEEVGKQMRTVRNLDLRLCDVSDFIIAHINPSVASWGSAEEIVTSVRSKKPVYISIEGGRRKTPFWLLGMLPSEYFFDSPMDILSTLRQIDLGQKAMDPDRWRLLMEHYR